MRLLILDQFSDPGGAQQQLVDLLPALRHRAWQAVVGMPGNGRLFDQVRAAGFETARIHCGPYASGRKSLADIGRFLGGAPRLARQVRALARQVDAGLIYVNGPRLLPAVALARIDRPVLFHAHRYLPSGFAHLLTEIALGRLGASVVANCHYVADQWRRLAGPRKLSVVYNGVAPPAPTPHPPPPVPAGVPRIGCIGRIAPEKGQKEFLAAASLIHRALPASRFAIYGAALFAEPAALRYERQVWAAAQALPVEFAGWVGDVYQALATLDLLLVPSLGHEATTRVILEAFAAGVPVIAFRAGGIPEVVEHGRTGFLCDSPAEMARLAIDLLTGDPHRLTELRAAARESWQTQFTLERWRCQLLERMEQCRA
jgi:glycosyltransferase involved in cell wall biosynthesis